MTEQLSRLISLAGSDGGFYILAIRSFIEQYMREFFPHFDDDWTVTFNNNLYNYKKYLIEKNPGKNLVELSSFKALMDLSLVADGVYHNFETVSPEEVRAATFSFLQFCRAAEIDHDLLYQLKTSLEFWEHRSSRSDDLAELRRVREELVQLKKENCQLLEQYAQLEELRTVRKYLEERIESLNQNSREMADELEQLKSQRREVKEKIDGFGEVDQYVKKLLRVSLYSRTRMDYERSLTKLTDEQEEVLEAISLKKNFLIKGGAGTGKTLILLEALKRANEGVLAFASRKILLLTYTTTLVKYDRFLSRILKIGESDSSISTADRFLNTIFEEHFPQLRVEYNLIEKMCREKSQDLFSDPRLLQREIEDFLWAYAISREEYIDNMIPRRGLKGKLNREDRENVWKIKEEFESAQNELEQVSKAYSRYLLSAVKLEPDFDHVFIDESQDLLPVELMILKKTCHISLIMAGDTDQSIYGIGAPYKRAALVNASTTRILKSNFRNSIAIHKLAEDFRKRGPETFDKGISPLAFREGPAPELYTSEDTEKLYDQLVQKLKIFLNTIEYDAENICILAPGVKFLQKISKKLKEEEIDSVMIKDPDFDFEDKGRVRLSPLHSSKGIDIPVVMLFIPTLFYNKELEELESQALMRNLIYVSMTRAMENLNIFTKAESSDPLIGDLKELLTADEW